MTQLTPREKVLVEALKRIALGASTESTYKNDGYYRINDEAMKALATFSTLHAWEEVCRRCHHPASQHDRGMCENCLGPGVDVLCDWPKAPSREPSPDRATLEIEPIIELLKGIYETAEAIADRGWNKDQPVFKHYGHEIMMKAEDARVLVSRLSSAPTQGARRWKEDDIVGYLMSVESGQMGRDVTFDDLSPKVQRALQGAPEDVGRDRTLDGLHQIEKGAEFLLEIAVQEKLSLWWQEQLDSMRMIAKNAASTKLESSGAQPEGTSNA